MANKLDKKTDGNTLQEGVFCRPIILQNFYIINKRGNRENFNINLDGIR